MDHKDLREKQAGLLNASAFELAVHLGTNRNSKYSEGFTICPRTTFSPNFKRDMYVVSVRGGERRFPHYPSAEQIHRWLLENQVELSMPARYVGGWRNLLDGYFYLDVSVIVSGQVEAERVGLLNGQTSIYHPATRTTIYLPKTEGEEAA